jgi:uncharacterized phage protein (TIGR02218 family)
MKTGMSAALIAHYAQEVTTICQCLKLTRKDGTVMGFTSLDDNVTYDGLTYYATTGGVGATAISSSSYMSVSNLQMEGFLSSAAITEDDLAAGLYSHAAIELFEINYEDVTMGACTLLTGHLGEAKQDDNRFAVDIRSLTNLLSQPIGDLFSPDCRADLGDTQCGITLATWTVTGTVTSVDSSHPQYIFTDSSRTEAVNYFRYGKLTWTSGDNDGLSVEVKEFISNEFTLFDSLPNTSHRRHIFSLSRV